MDASKLPASVDPAFKFNPHSRLFCINPFPVYKLLRENFPVYFCEELNGWLLTRYDDVVESQRDVRLTLSYLDAGGGDGEYKDKRGKIEKESILTLGGEDHLKLKRFIMMEMMPERLNGLAAAIKNIVAGKIDAIDGGQFNAVDSFSKHIPVEVISVLLGIPPCYREELLRFTYAYVRVHNPTAQLGGRDLQVVESDVCHGIDLVKMLISRARKAPDGGLISRISNSKITVKPPSDDQIALLICAIIAAGSDTTVFAISNTLLNVLRSPAARSILDGSSEMWERAVMETLRFDFPTKLAVPRFALQDFELRGCKIKRGDMVFGSIAAAHRDPDIFENPDVFDIERDLSKNIAFGRSQYTCIGRNLAVLEASLAGSGLLHAFPDLTLAGDIEYDLGNKISRALSRLPVRGSRTLM